MAGVLEGFAAYVAEHTDAHLILAGPQTSGVADDPEADQVLRACLARWFALPGTLQRRTHLASIPMVDADENATIINALQRHANIVVQKSIAEGFGLTVAEAMWKSRPVVATAIGGILEQVVPGETGLLLGNSEDLEQYANAVRERSSTTRPSGTGWARTRRRTVEQFLGDRHLQQWAQLFTRLDGG